MVTKQEYEQAVQQRELSEKTIQDYFDQKREAFKIRLKNNPVFVEDELYYSAHTLCPCGHGLAYPKDCGPNHYWDCSAILKGIADPNIRHTGRLPFVFYDIKGESECNGTTRGRGFK